MCSNPQQGINQETGEEITFACRVCNQCISTRKNTWVARGMAEMETAAHTHVLNLTYRNTSDGSLPIAARAFRYKDVQILMKRIRNHAKREYGNDFELRYIVAGERGSQKNRVHWHIILFASHDIFALGEWSNFYFEPIDAPRPKRMDDWTLWDHGHIVTDEASQASLSYTLKYCIKDQFNVEKARGTGRYAKSELHGASMFRMSKKPPIGWRFLFDKLERLEEQLSVPPTLQVNVPSYSGYWYPTGACREWYLAGLAYINQTHRERYGRDCPQWSTLLASVSENEKDQEQLGVLLPEEEETPAQFEERIAERNAEHARAGIHYNNRRQCGAVHICEACFVSLTPSEKAHFQEWKEWTQSRLGDNWQTKFRAENRPNPYCRYAEERKKHFRAFANLGT